LKNKRIEKEVQQGIWNKIRKEKNNGVI